MSISIHAPCTGSDLDEKITAERSEHFNPRSLHGERRKCCRNFGGTVNFNPRSLHGERRFSICRTARTRRISIHAPCTGSDSRCRLAGQHHAAFQSTLPARGATHYAHPPLNLLIFQSTLPARGATQPSTSPPKRASTISIHAPCTGSD